MLDTLAIEVKELSALDPHALSDEELCEATVELARQRAALEATHARLMRVVAARKAYADSGAKSAAAWLAHETHLPTGECGALAWLGRSMSGAPLVDAAFSAGEIGAAHVRRLGDVRSPRSIVAFARDEAMLLGWARELSFEQFCQCLDLWLLYADPDGADRSAMDKRDRRRVSLDQTIFGMYSGSILLDPISGVIVKGELDRLEQILFAADWAEAKDRLGREPQLHELRRTPDQRRADALVEMAKRSGAMPKGARKPRPLFTVVLGEDRLADLCQLGSGAVVPPSGLLRWLDAAELEAILFDGKGRAIEVSRRRLFLGALRRIIEVRDRCCYHPTCDEPAERCQVDHIEPHAEGGMTSQDNGQLACGFHNRLRNGRRRRRGPPPEDDEAKNHSP